MTDVLTHEVRGVPSALVAEVWPGVAALVERAAARWPGDRTGEDYLAACRCADAQLWLVSRDGKLRGCFVTEVLNFPCHRIAVVELMAGEGWDEWAGDLDRAVEPWARAMGCARIRSGGRRGLTKAAEREGFRMVGVILEKDLTHGCG